jgi:DNA-binding NtrC family response regulator
MLIISNILEGEIMNKQVLCIDKDPGAKEIYENLIGYNFHYANDICTGCEMLEANKDIATIIVDDLVDDPISCLVEIKRKFRGKKVLVITENNAIKSFVNTIGNWKLIDPPFDLDSIRGQLGPL